MEGSSYPKGEDITSKRVSLFHYAMGLINSSGGRRSINSLDLFRRVTTKKSLS